MIDGVLQGSAGEFPEHAGDIALGHVVAGVLAFGGEDAAEDDAAIGGGDEVYAQPRHGVGAADLTATELKDFAADEILGAISLGIHATGDDGMEEGIVDGFLDGYAHFEHFHRGTEGGGGDTEEEGAFAAHIDKISDRHHGLAHAHGTFAGFVVQADLCVGATGEAEEGEQGEAVELEHERWS